MSGIKAHPKNSSIGWSAVNKDLLPLIHCFIKKSDAILIPGCGNAPFSADLHAMGFVDQANIDLSRPVIRQMAMRNMKRAKMRFIQMDACNLSFADDSFDIVFDKAVLDTLYCDGQQSEQERSALMVDEMYRVLRPGGHYIITSLNVEANLLPMLTKTRYNWICSKFNVGPTNEDAMADTHGVDDILPPTYQVVVCKKLLFSF
jgi:SAM-dependent methyltransferase